ncbi:hypothetical protein N7532_004004 [Penicillium argentinense]|uniref:Uncharacterized protein n=1 Tax=Penicillium argentinense TaxID=1131581 RepID=A0A9W9FP10_9EURO|nr:uncharacterized protein N7532_004004 [Penicillium argentinense]KAJ5103475.1 hypothetical protein N7532_004004 [Penicillium argentinense]
MEILTLLNTHPDTGETAVPLYTQRELVAMTQAALDSLDNTTRSRMELSDLKLLAADASHLGTMTSPYTGLPDPEDYAAGASQPTKVSSQQMPPPPVPTRSLQLRDTKSVEGNSTKKELG